MGAGDSRSIGRRNEADGVFDYALYAFVIIGRIAFVAGLEIEYLSVSAIVEDAGAKNLAARVITDKQNLVGVGNNKRFAVGFLALEAEEAVNPSRNRVCRVDYPENFGIVGLPPREVTGGAHKRLKRL